MRKLLFVVCVFLTHTTLAQQLTGKVVDETNQPLPQVVIRTDSQTTYSNFDGLYEIELNDTPTKVSFNFMGYDEYTVTTNRRGVGR